MAKETIKSVQEVILDGVNAKRQENLTCTLHIPQQLPPTEETCACLKVKYEIKVFNTTVIKYMSNINFIINY